MSLLSTCRYFRGVAEFRGVATLEGLCFQWVVTFGILRYIVCDKGYAPLSKIHQVSPEFIAVFDPNSTFKCGFQFHVQGSNKFQEFLVYRTLATKMTQCKSLISQTKLLNRRCQRLLSQARRK